MSRLVATAMVAFAAVAKSAAGQCEYEIAHLVSGPGCGLGTVAMLPNDINEDGAVAGWYACPLGQPKPFLIVEGQLLTPSVPDLLDGEFTAVARDLRVVGQGSFRDVVGQRGFIFDVNSGNVIVVEPLPGGNTTRFFDINDAGTCVGNWGNTVTGVPVGAEALTWREGQFVQLGEVVGVPSTSFAINSSGQVAGRVGGGLGPRGWIWDDGVVTELGPIPRGTSSVATDINDRGDVIGLGNVPLQGDTLNASFIYSRGRMELLVEPGQFNRVIARGLNRFRQVVGSVDGRIVLWQHGRVQDLELLISGMPKFALLQDAPDVNDRGEIVVNGTINADPVGVAIVLVPIERPFADIDIDCRVGDHDLVYLLDFWGTDDQHADLDGDGHVGFADLVLLLGHWG